MAGSSYDVDYNIKASVDKASVNEAKRDLNSITESAKKSTDKLRAALDVSSGSKKKDILGLRSQIGVTKADLRTIDKFISEYEKQVARLNDVKAKLDDKKRERKNTQKRLAGAERRRDDTSLSADARSAAAAQADKETKLLAQQDAEVAKLQRSYEALKAPVKGMEKTLQGYNEQLSSSEAAADELFQKMGVTYQETDKLATTANSMNSGFDAAAASAGRLARTENEANTAQAQTQQATVKTISEVERLAKAYAQYSAELEKATAAGQDTANIERNLRSVTEQLNERLNRKVDTSNYADMSRYLRELYQAQKAIEQLGMPKELDDFYNQITTKIEQTKQSMYDYKREARGVADSHRGAKDSAEEFGKAVQLAGSMGRKGLAAIGIVIGVVQKGFNNLSKSTSGVSKSISNIVKSLTKNIHKIDSSFDKMARNMRSKFKHLITSITKYVLGFRSLFFLVRRLRKYIGEGIQNMAQFAGGNNHVNESITRLLSSLLYLKNAWATAFSPILQVVTPILEGLIDTIASVGNAFSRFLGSLLGVTTVFQAVKVDAADYAKSLDKAGGSAGKAADKTKKLTDRLAAFDDLNVLGKDNDPDATGSKGGGGGADAYTPDPNEMFKLVEVGTGMLDHLKEMWANADFTSLGERAGQKIIDALNGIDWAGIKDTVWRIGKSIITFLNGALGDEALWRSVGATIGEGINTVGMFLSAILENNEVDWGGGLANLINSLFDTVNWDIVKSNIITFGELLKTNIISFLQTLDWEGIKDAVSGIATALGTAIADLINDPTLVSELGVAAGEIFNLLLSVISDVFLNNPADLGSAIATFLGNLFETVDWETFNADLEGFGQLIVDNFNSFFANLNLFGEGGMFGDMSGAAEGFTSAIVTIIENLDFNAIINSAVGIAEALITGIAEGLKNSDNPVLQSLGGIIESIGKAIQTILPVVAPLVELIVTGLSSALEVIAPLIEPLSEVLLEVGQSILPIITAALEAFTPILAELEGSYLGALVDIFTALQPAFEEFATNLLPQLGELFGLCADVVVELWTAISSLWENTGDLSGTIVELLGVALKPILALLKPITEILVVVIDLVASLLGPIIQLIDPLLQLLVSCMDPLMLVFELWAKLIETFVVPAVKLISSLIKVVFIPILDLLVVGVTAVSNVLGMAGLAISVFGSLALGVFDDIKAGIADVCNGIIGSVEAFVNAIINGFNGMISNLNKLSFEVPDWVPDYGGQEFGFSIPKLSTVSLPRLAQGAVIPPNKEFMAVLGDQKNGTNIEAPLDTIKQAVAEVMGTGGNAEVIQLLQQLITVVENKNLTIGDKEIGKANARYTNQQRMIRGTSF